MRRLGRLQLQDHSFFADADISTPISCGHFLASSGSCGLPRAISSVPGRLWAPVDHSDLLPTRSSFIRQLLAPRSSLEHPRATLSSRGPFRSPADTSELHRPVAESWGQFRACTDNSAQGSCELPRSTGVHGSPLRFTPDNYGQSRVMLCECSLLSKSLTGRKKPPARNTEYKKNRPTLRIRTFPGQLLTFPDIWC